MTQEAPVNPLDDRPREVQTVLGGIREVDATSGPQVALTGPATLSAGNDTAFTFAQPVNHVWIQNKSGGTITMEFDAAATLGSIELADGDFGSFDAPISAVHLLGAAASPVNGSAGANIKIRGWL